MPSFPAKRAIFAILFAAIGCDGGSGPTLEPIDPVSGRVNEELTIQLVVDNPSGAPVTLSVEDPMLPSFGLVTTLSSDPTGGTFRWVPLSSHAGMHELTFVLSAGPGGAEYDRESVVVEILPAADAAPVFVRPGAGGTYDLTQSPCVTFDVEVRDDDSDSVTIGTRSDPPEGATITSAGQKRATFEWCPTPDQVASSERWTIELQADDGDHPAVEHDYVVVLRSGPTREGCPGSPPAITLHSPLMDERITSGAAYAVDVMVADDMGLRDAPLLYYTTSEPEDPAHPDVTLFELVSFTDAGGGSFSARIPSLGLAMGEEATVYYFVSATDNDDASGTSCDHRTDSELVSFVAVGGAPPDGMLDRCEPCAASTECSSGICAATAGGGRCAEGCSGGGECSSGTCGATVTTEGGTRAGCGPLGEVCGGESGSCTDDAREDDDTPSDASTYTSAIGDGQICAGDEDYVAITASRGDRVTVTVDGFVSAEGDLDLQLRSAAGAVLASSASVRDVEMASTCAPGTAPTVYARVYGYSGAQNGYQLHADVSPDPACGCAEDGGEDDDTRASARAVTFTSTADGERADFDGVLCGADEDWIAIPMSGPGRIQITVLFTDASGDIDLHLYDPSGVRVGSSLGTADEEDIDAMVPGGGTYALRIFTYGTGNPDGYVGEVLRTVGTGCASTLECPADTVCASGSCASDACTSDASCPPMHSCPSAGPSGAERHCAAACTVNADCRSSEACKWFVGGRGCGRRGSGANGDGCESFADCGGQRACLDWPGGYCARASCTTNADCESGTFCVTQDGQNVCALHCVSSACREAEGYTCAYTPTIGDVARFVCLPP